jgi:L-ascorbate metabolism protein UlaG (beta-lactamase superfamily)
MKSLLSTVLVSFVLLSCNNNTSTKKSSPNEAEKTSVEVTQEQNTSSVDIKPVSHASFVLKSTEHQFFVDPVNAEAFAQFSNPDYILITDIHGDHFNPKSLENLKGNANIIAPQAVYDLMPADLKTRTKVLTNGDTLSLSSSTRIEAIPMYNTTKGRLDKHPKGRGNGYVLSVNDYKIYISGDTEDIKEMRALKNIDLALVCMNLPYTMDLNQAADAVLEFKPKKVMPYHYRGRKEGETYYEDVEEFKSIVTKKDNSIEVELLDWYAI